MISRESLQSILSYDEETGLFLWKISRGHCVAGRQAGSIVAGYRIISINYRKYRAHQLAWLYVHGEFVKEIDHRNRDRADNRIANLRPASRSQNNANAVRKNKFGKGVFYHSGHRLYVAAVYKEGVRFRLGYFKTAELAHAAYCAAASKLYGEFARFS